MPTATLSPAYWVVRVWSKEDREWSDWAEGDEQTMKSEYQMAKRELPHRQFALQRRDPREMQ